MKIQFVRQVHFLKKLLKNQVATKWYQEPETPIQLYYNPFVSLDQGERYKDISQRKISPLHEEIPHVQGQRRSPSKMAGGENSRLESNPIPVRDAQRAQTNLVCTRTQEPHRAWDRTQSVSCGGVGQQWAATGTGALGAANLGMA